MALNQLIQCHQNLGLGLGYQIMTDIGLITGWFC